MARGNDACKADPSSLGFGESLSFICQDIQPFVPEDAACLYRSEEIQRATQLSIFSDYLTLAFIYGKMAVLED